MSQDEGEEQKSKKEKSENNHLMTQQRTQKDESK